MPLLAPLQCARRASSRRPWPASHDPCSARTRKRPVGALYHEPRPSTAGGNASQASSQCPSCERKSTSWPPRGHGGGSTPP
eukprot:11217035-Lingulodinium_polyedra.AAC.1